jgi:hypothetical protein
MESKQEFSPLCDLHHSRMRRLMLEGSAPSEGDSFHTCERRDCTRVFRESSGYSDLVGAQFDDSRASSKLCPGCAAILYLAEVDHGRKIENWECPHLNCGYTEEISSPSSR